MPHNSNITFITTYMMKVINVVIIVKIAFSTIKVFLTVQLSWIILLGQLTAISSFTRRKRVG
jgi:phosphosulfolactate phosphohydrolase-like enzyme